MIDREDVPVQLTINLTAYELNEFFGDTIALYHSTDVVGDQLEQAVKRAHFPRCDITGNEWGTDTRLEGTRCGCVSCVQVHDGLKARDEEYDGGVVDSEPKIII